MTALAATRFIQSACSFTLLAFILAGCTVEPADDADSSQTTGGTTGVGGTGGSGTTGGTGGAATGGTGGVATGGAATGGAVGTGGGVGTGGVVGTGGEVGTGGVGTGGEVGTGGAGTGGSSAFALTSPDLTEGGVFADKYTCSAAGFQGSLSPELVWTAGPAGTKSYAITFIDTTLTEGQPPSDLGYHWVIYDIPATTLGLPEEFKDATGIGAKQNGNYLGPCPNFGGGSETHTYEFTIYALDTEALTLTATSGTAAVKEAEGKLEASNLASTKLRGTSDASPP
jgi:Raf kinase inhibitor-like YbhB/YbcL family protein